MEIPEEVKYILEARHDENMEHLEDSARDTSLSEFLSENAGTIKQTEEIRRCLGGLDEFNPISLWIEVTEDKDRNSTEANQEGLRVDDPQ